MKNVDFCAFFAKKFVYFGEKEYFCIESAYVCVVYTHTYVARICAEREVSLI